MSDKKGSELDRLVKARRQIFESRACIGCNQQAVMFLTIGNYQLWMCEEHARYAQAALNFIVPNADQQEESEALGDG